MQRAVRDLDDIYNHIADDFKGIGKAKKMADGGYHFGELRRRKHGKKH
jgi:hypothetical protein